MRRQGAPSRHYPLTGNYPLSSGSAGGDARESSLSSISLPISACPFFIRQPEKSWNGRFHCLAGKERKQLEREAGFRNVSTNGGNRKRKKERKRSTVAALLRAQFI